MRAIRPAAAVLSVITFAGVAYVAQLGGTTGPNMVEAAKKFLDGLSPELRAKASFKADDQERFKWEFVPLEDRASKQPTRKGLRMEEMSATQRDTALALLQTGTSASGYTAATTIMSLESILKELEQSGPIRNPGWYFVSIFGTPAATGKWGWRIEGHHLSVNFTVENGQVSSATPCFFGANPATVMAGPRKGTRAIPEVDDLARELFTSLDADQKKLAESSQPFPEPASKTQAANVGAPVGVPAAKLNDKQRGTLMKLIQAYTGRLPEEIAHAELARITQAGIEKVHFAFQGGTEQGKEHTYRLQGPTFVAEFLNRQADSARNPANHIHSAWRHLPKDFGLSAN